MSIVIVGGNERMVCQYQNICKNYGCKAKVFAKEKGSYEKETGLSGFDDFVYKYSIS